MGQKGSIAYVWAPIGSRPPMLRDNRHDSVHLFGAICPARGVGAAIIMPAVNIEAMNEHLREISTQVAPGAHAGLICDGAGWHQQGRALLVPHNITLLPLPPYAPELNAMENVWDYLRANKLSSLVWDIFPNEASIIRLIGAVLLEANDEWQLQNRYMDIEAMAELLNPRLTNETLQIQPKAA